MYVLYQRGSGHFEVSLNMHILAKGRAYVPMEGLKKLWVKQPPTLEGGRVVTSQDEVYDELERRGVHVSGQLRAIKQVVVSTSGESSTASMFLRLSVPNTLVTTAHDTFRRNLENALDKFRTILGHIHPNGEMI